MRLQLSRWRASRPADRQWALRSRFTNLTLWRSWSTLPWLVSALAVTQCTSQKEALGASKEQAAFRVAVEDLVTSEAKMVVTLDVRPLDSTDDVPYSIPVLTAAQKAAIRAGRARLARSLRVSITDTASLAANRCPGALVPPGKRRTSDWEACPLNDERHVRLSAMFVQQRDSVLGRGGASSKTFVSHRNDVWAVARIRTLTPSGGNVAYELMVLRRDGSGYRVAARIPIGLAY